MACGSCGGAAAARATNPNEVFVVRFADGTRSKPYPDKLSADVALSRSGKAGKVQQEAKAA